jgi:hypothetical protein
VSAELEDVRWDVELVTGEFHDVGASSIHIEDGCLVFRDSDGFILVAYGVGYWRAVSGS